MGQCTIRTVETTNENGDSVEVLYQKLGDRWYAFSMINDEVFVGSISPDALNDEVTHQEPLRRSA